MPELFARLRIEPAGQEKFESERFGAFALIVNETRLRHERFARSDASVRISSRPDAQ